MLAALKRLATKVFSGLEKEQEVLEELNLDVRATVERLTSEDPGLKGVIDKAYAYAVFPSVGKASAVIGGAFGKGEVFQGTKMIGYAGVAQLTLGVQIGGQTFSELVVFENKDALEEFKAGKTRFAANASAALVKAGAATTNDTGNGTRVFVYSEGGMMLEMAIGAQKFFYRSAFLGKTKDAPREAMKKSSARARKRATPGKKTPKRSASKRAGSASSRTRRRSSAR